MRLVSLTTPRSGGSTPSSNPQGESTGRPHASPRTRAWPSSAAMSSGWASSSSRTRRKSGLPPIHATPKSSSPTSTAKTSTNAPTPPPPDGSSTSTIGRRNAHVPIRFHTVNSPNTSSLNDNVAEPMEGTHSGNRYRNGGGSTEKSALLYGKQSRTCRKCWSSLLSARPSCRYGYLQGRSSVMLSEFLRLMIIAPRQSCHRHCIEHGPSPMVRHWKRESATPRQTCLRLFLSLKLRNGSVLQA